MKFQNITVSGIVNIVVNRKVKWTLSEGVWQRENRSSMLANALNTHEQMMEIVAHLKEDRRYRMWIHGDTLNIVRKEQTI